jgi:type IV secretory pathway TraG/TraD family ATPase VirD4
MIIPRKVQLVVLGVGLALCLLAAATVSMLLAWLSWTPNWRAAAAVLIAIAVWRRGHNAWTEFEVDEGQAALHRGAIQWFFLRELRRFATLVVVAAVGYRVAAVGLSFVQVPTWLQRAGREIDGYVFSHCLSTFPPDAPGWNGLGRYASAIVVALIARTFFNNSWSSDLTFRRGRQLLTAQEAQALAKRHTNADGTFPLGGVDMPDAAAATHICLMGATGSGKTKTVEQIIEYAAKPIGSGLDHRMVLFDPKREMVPFVHGLGVRCRVYILNPFDTRCHSWNMGRDCISPASIQQVTAAIVSGEAAGPNQFFIDAGREITAGTMVGLTRRAPDDWTLRDVLLILRDQSLLQQVLADDPETRDICHYFREPRTYQNIHATLSSKLSAYSPIAACWHRASESIALRDWIHSESILVLGYDPSVSLAMRVINRAVYQRLCELLLAQPASTDRRVWHVVDEAKELGRLDSLPQIATFGRGAGNRLVIGFQDVDGMRHVYGKELSAELIGQCATKAILRLDSHETAEVAGKIIADGEYLERRRSGMQDGKPKSGSLSESLVRRQTVLTGELLNLPATNRQNGMSGYYVSPFTGVFKSTVSPDAIDKIPKPDPNIPGFISRPVEHQYLLPFTSADYKRLRLKPKTDRP